MKFSKDELEYIALCLKSASNYAVARGQLIDHPGVKHKDIQRKVQDYIYQLKN